MLPFAGSEENKDHSLHRMLDIVILGFIVLVLGKKYPRADEFVVCDMKAAPCVMVCVLFCLSLK